MLRLWTFLRLSERIYSVPTHIPLLLVFIWGSLGIYSMVFRPSFIAPASVYFSSVPVQTPTTEDACVLRRRVYTKGEGVYGVLQCGDNLWRTLEHERKLIAPGHYLTKVRFVPRFNRLLAEVQSVYRRSGIYVHVGYEQSDSEGCILVSANAVDEVTRVLGVSGSLWIQ